MADELRDWTRGDRFEAAHLQEPVTALRKLLGVPGAGVGDLRGRSDDGRFQWFVGKIVGAGPDDEDDFSDGRYWVQPQFISGEGMQDDRIELSDRFPVPRDSKPTLAADAIVPVTNLPERMVRSHSLSIGTFVTVICVYDGQDPPVLRYLMSETEETCLAKIDIFYPEVLGYSWAEVRPEQVGGDDPDEWTYVDGRFGTGGENYAIDPEQGLDGTARYSPGQVVLLRRSLRSMVPEGPDSESEVVPVWVICAGGSGSSGNSTVVIEITDTHAGIGFYVAKIVSFAGDIDPDGDLGAQAGSGDEVIAMNLTEAGASEHWIDPGGNQRNFLAVYVWTNEDGTAVYAFNGFQTTVCA